MTVSWHGSEVKDELAAQPPTHPLPHPQPGMRVIARSSSINFRLSKNPLSDKAILMIEDNLYGEDMGDECHCAELVNKFSP